MRYTNPRLLYFTYFTDGMTDTRGKMFTYMQAKYISWNIVFFRHNNLKSVTAFSDLESSKLM